MDHHWLSQYDICRPCRITYDYIGHYETIQDDANYILHKIGAGSNVHFPQSDYNIKSPRSSKYLNLFYSVPVSDIRHLLHIYQKDYTVFGYKIPDVILRRIKERLSERPSSTADYKQ